ncbi:unknown [Oscillibacter sp. CAG:155]|nr:unknown [Oscillibacter sp. CAG:155]
MTDHIHHGLGLNGDDGGVVFNVDLGTGLDFFLGVDAVLDEQVHVLLGSVHGQGIRRGGQVGKAALLGLGDPGVVIAVAVEDNPLMLGKGLSDELLQIGLEVLGGLQLIGKLLELLGHDGVQSDIGAGDGLGGTQHPELELVAGEGHGRGAVAVGVVLGNGGQHVHADLQRPLAGILVLRALDDGIHYAAQLVAQEDGQYGGRSLLSAQTVVIAGEGHGGPQEVLIVIHALDEGGQEQQELGVLAGRGAGLEEVLAAVGGQGPVVVLAGAVDAGKGLFVQQAHQTVAVGHLLHDLHGQLVLVAGGVGVGVDGGHLVLRGRHFVVLGLAEDAQGPEGLVQVLHVRGDPGLDGAEVVILQLLALGGLGAEQRPAAEAQVLPLLVELLIYQEILLLGTHLGGDTLGLRVAEEPQNPDGLTAYLVHGPQ